MKVVIDVPYDQYVKICAGDFDTSGYFKMNLRDAFRNGIPLPKGHGRLVDADAITKDLNTLQDSFVIAIDRRTGAFVGVTCTAPTIIEADKESEQE